MPAVTFLSFETDKRGQILNSTKVEYAKASLAVEAKQNDSDLMLFVDCDKEKVEAVNSFVQSHALQMYPTKSRTGRRWIIGNVKGSSQTTIETELA